MNCDERHEMDETSHSKLTQRAVVASSSARVSFAQFERFTVALGIPQVDKNLFFKIANKKFWKSVTFVTNRNLKTNMNVYCDRIMGWFHSKIFQILFEETDLKLYQHYITVFPMDLSEVIYKYIYSSIPIIASFDGSYDHRKNANFCGVIPFLKDPFIRSYKCRVRENINLDLNAADQIIGPSNFLEPFAVGQCLDGMKKYSYHELKLSLFKYIHDNHGRVRGVVTSKVKKCSMGRWTLW